MIGTRQIFVEWKNEEYRSDLPKRPSIVEKQTRILALLVLYQCLFNSITLSLH